MSRAVPVRIVRLLKACERQLNLEAENYRDDDFPSGKANYQPNAKGLHKLADRIGREVARCTRAADRGAR